MTDLLSFDPASPGPLLSDTGSTRYVYALSDFLVAKIERGNEHSEGVNLYEIERWKLAEAEGWSYLLAPLVAWADDGAWIIQERVTPLEQDPRKLTTEELAEYDEVMGTLYRDHDVWDLGLYNFGRRKNGDLVCLDFVA